MAYEALTEGQQVEFEVMRTPKGPAAANVRLAEYKRHPDGTRQGAVKEGK